MRTYGCQMNVYDSDRMTDLLRPIGIIDNHHDHLIDVASGKVIEFYDPEIERLQEEVARRLGYRLVSHRLELFALPLIAKDNDTKDY